MTKTSTTTDSVARAPRGPAAVVQPLADTLAAELESLHALHSLTADQLAALQNADSDTLDALTGMVGETLARMKRLQQTRGRQTRLAARVLKLSTDTVTIEEIAGALAAHGDEDSLRASAELARHRAELRERATVASRKADALTFALHHALTLGPRSADGFAGASRSSRPAALHADRHADRHLARRRIRQQPRLIHSTVNPAPP